MDPESYFVQMYNDTPVVPGVAAHSIIAVKNPNDPKEEWNDGVVEYKVRSHSRFVSCDMGGCLFITV